MYSSYIIYILTILIAMLFAFFAQKYKKTNSKGEVKAHPLFLFLSMLPLFFTMGFRDISVGVDGYNYLNGYLTANNVGIFQYYTQNVTEPGFYLLYRISYLFGDFQWLFIFSAFITVFFTLKALSNEITKISFPLAVFVFATVQYFYFFGIMRMGIAVALIAFAYKYVIQGNKKKLTFFVLLATMFHYSALFALILLFFTRNKEEQFKKSNLFKIIFIIPIGFFLVRYFVFPFVTAGRYQGYIESSGTLSTDFLSSVPLGIFFLIYFIRRGKEDKNYQFYFLLFSIKIITEIFAPIIGIGRMVWYVNLSIAFLFPYTIRSSKDKGIKLLILILAISYCLIYSYFAYFGNSWRGENMLPYKFFFEV